MDPRETRVQANAMGTSPIRLRPRRTRVADVVVCHPTRRKWIQRAGCEEKEAKGTFHAVVEPSERAGSRGDAHGRHGSEPSRLRPAAGPAAGGRTQTRPRDTGHVCVRKRRRRHGEEPDFQVLGEVDAEPGRVTVNVSIVDRKGIDVGQYAFFMGKRTLQAPCKDIGHQQFVHDPGRRGGDGLAFRSTIIRGATGRPRGGRCASTGRHSASRMVRAIPSTAYERKRSSRSVRGRRWACSPAGIQSLFFRTGLVMRPHRPTDPGLAIHLCNSFSFHDQVLLSVKLGFLASRPWSRLFVRFGSKPRSRPSDTDVPDRDPSFPPFSLSDPDSFPDRSSGRSGSLPSFRLGSVLLGESNRSISYPGRVKEALLLLLPRGSPTRPLPRTSTVVLVPNVGSRSVEVPPTAPFPAERPPRRPASGTALPRPPVPNPLRASSFPPSLSPFPSPPFAPASHRPRGPPRGVLACPPPVGGRGRGTHRGDPDVL
eukprot:scaffold585_cov330-Pavlova_lutheri.AAC.11